ncbi:DinB family protein [bacterium]|nr:DinB family protein [bacterium]
MSVFTNPASAATADAKNYVTAVLQLLGDSNPYEVLEELPHFLDSIVAGLPDEKLRAPEAEGKWSIIAVIQHLADSELVWAYRMRMILAQDGAEITGYDQDLWAKRLKYETADLNNALTQLKILRKANLALVTLLTNEELQRVGNHKERGEESPEYMIRLYARHDLVHRRQLIRIKDKVT